MTINKVVQKSFTNFDNAINLFKKIKNGNIELGKAKKKSK